MKKLRLEVILEYNDNIMHGDDKDAIEWFYDFILGEELGVHSNHIGDIIGTIKVLKIKK